MDFFIAIAKSETVFSLTTTFERITFDFVTEFSFYFIMNNIQGPHAGAGTSINCVNYDSILLSTTPDSRPVGDPSSEKVNFLF